MTDCVTSHGSPAAAEQRFLLVTTIHSCGYEWGRHLELITVQMPVCTL